MCVWVCVRKCFFSMCLCMQILIDWLICNVCIVSNIMHHIENWIVCVADLMRSALEFGLFDAINKICTLFKAYLHPSYSVIYAFSVYLNFTSDVEIISCTPVHSICTPVLRFLTVSPILICCTFIILVITHSLTHSHACTHAGSFTLSVCVCGSILFIL